MTRTAYAIIAALSALATPLLVQAAGLKPAPAAPPAVAVVETVAAAPAPMAVEPAAATAGEASQPCRRQVRVVYSGFSPLGEGSCLAAAKPAR